MGQGRRALAARRRRDLLDAYPAMDFPVLLLWADEDTVHPLAIAEEALKPCPTPNCAHSPAPDS